MKHFCETISLSRNARGCYILDTVKGCPLASSQVGGCYGECYAAKIAARYRYDFGFPVLRRFIDDKHFVRIARAINRIEMPFVRIGEMGDPSYDWEHTTGVIKRIKKWCDKKIVIITKHINRIPSGLLDQLKGVCVNTSISAMDSEQDRENRICEYIRLKPHCDSVLRVVSCRFNILSDIGNSMANIQKSLLLNDRVIETAFRPSTKNKLVRSGVVLVERKKFLLSVMPCSTRESNIFLGHCTLCRDMCGLRQNGVPLFTELPPRQFILVLQ